MTTSSTSEVRLLRAGAAIALFLAGGIVAGLAVLATSEPKAARDGKLAGADTTEFTPPPLDSIPDGPAGESIRRGMQIFNATYADPAAGHFVGNAMACTNCHIDGGRKADSSPMWAAWVSYPQYRKKNNSINTMTDRIKGCFVYSMNASNSLAGEAPPEDSDIYRDLENYFYWLAKGAPTGEKMRGGGFLKLDVPKDGYDIKRGEAVYAKACAQCHAPDGGGAQHPDGYIVYPALWGPRSYNWGAGMAQVNNAAGFIRANMPLDKPGSLTEQDAWDVAAFIDSHERPKDPRQTGTVAENAAKHFAEAKTFYGKQVDGKLVGVGVPGERLSKLPTYKPGEVIRDPALVLLENGAR